MARFSDASHQRRRSQRGKRVQAWYKCAKWRRLRRAQLNAYPLCQCPHCMSGNTEPREATVVDHDSAHKGNRTLFFDQSNLRSLNKECHDRWKQSQETGGHGFMKGCDARGAPLNSDHPWHERT